MFPKLIFRGANLRLTTRYSVVRIVIVICLVQLNYIGNVEGSRKKSETSKPAKVEKSKTDICDAIQCAQIHPDFTCATTTVPQPKVTMKLGAFKDCCSVHQCKDNTEAHFIYTGIINKAGGLEMKPEPGKLFNAVPFGKVTKNFTSCPLYIPFSMVCMIEFQKTLVFQKLLKGEEDLCPTAFCTERTNNEKITRTFRVLQGQMPSGMKDIKKEKGMPMGQQKCPSIECMENPIILKNQSCKSVSIEDKLNRAEIDALGEFAECCPKLWHCEPSIGYGLEYMTYEMIGASFRYFSVILFDVVKTKDTANQPKQCAHISCPAMVGEGSHACTIDITGADRAFTEFAKDTLDCCPIYKCHDDKGRPKHGLIMLEGTEPDEGKYGCGDIKCGKKPQIKGVNCVQQQLNEVQSKGLGRALGDLKSCCPAWKCTYNDGRIYFHYVVSGPLFLYKEIQSASEKVKDLVVVVAGNKRLALMMPGYQIKGEYKEMDYDAAVGLVEEVANELSSNSTGDGDGEEYEIEYEYEEDDNGDMIKKTVNKSSKKSGKTRTNSTASGDIVYYYEEEEDDDKGNKAKGGKKQTKNIEKKSGGGNTTKSGKGSEKEEFEIIEEGKPQEYEIMEGGKKKKITKTKKKKTKKGKSEKDSKNNGAYDEYYEIEEEEESPDGGNKTRKIIRGKQKSDGKPIGPDGKRGSSEIVEEKIVKNGNTKKIIRKKNGTTVPEESIEYEYVDEDGGSKGGTKKIIKKKGKQKDGKSPSSSSTASKDGSKESVEYIEEEVEEDSPDQTNKDGQKKRRKITKKITKSSGSKTNKTTSGNNESVEIIEEEEEEDPNSGGKQGKKKKITRKITKNPSEKATTPKPQSPPQALTTSGPDLGRSMGTSEPGKDDNEDEEDVEYVDKNGRSMTIKRKKKEKHPEGKGGKRNSTSSPPKKTTSDGGDSYEEIETEEEDKNGKKRKVIKKVKKKKPDEQDETNKNNDDYEEVEYVDSDGNKKKILRKKKKTADGNNDDSSPSPPTKTDPDPTGKDSYENVEEEEVDENGNKRKVIKNIRKKKPGNDSQDLDKSKTGEDDIEEVEYVGADGKRKLKRKKKKKSRPSEGQGSNPSDTGSSSSEEWEEVTEEEEDKQSKKQQGRSFGDDDYETERTEHMNRPSYDQKGRKKNMKMRKVTKTKSNKDPRKGKNNKNTKTPPPRPTSPPSTPPPPPPPPTTPVVVVTPPAPAIPSVPETTLSPSLPVELEPEYEKTFQIKTGQCDKEINICPELKHMKGHCHKENDRRQSIVQYFPENEECCHLTHCYYKSTKTHATFYVKYAGKIPKNSLAKLHKEKGKDENDVCTKIKCKAQPTSEDCRYATEEEVKAAFPAANDYLDCCKPVKCLKRGSGAWSLELYIIATSFAYYELSYYNITLPRKNKALPEDDDDVEQPLTAEKLLLPLQRSFTTELTTIASVLLDTTEVTTAASISLDSTTKTLEEVVEVGGSDQELNNTSLTDLIESEIKSASDSESQHRDVTPTSQLYPFELSSGSCAAAAKTICPELDMGRICHRAEYEISLKMYFPRNETCCHLTHCVDDEENGKGEIHRTHYVKLAGSVPNELSVMEKEKGRSDESNSRSNKGQCPKIQCGNFTAQAHAESFCSVEFGKDKVSSSLIKPFLECCPTLECRRSDGSYSLEIQIMSSSFAYYELSVYNIRKWIDSKQKEEEEKASPNSLSSFGIGNGKCDSKCPMLDYPGCGQESRMSSNSKYFPDNEFCCPLIRCSTTKKTYQTHYVKLMGDIPVDPEAIRKAKFGGKKVLGSSSLCPTIKCGNHSTPEGKNITCKPAELDVHFYAYDQAKGFQECCPMLKCTLSDDSYYLESKIIAFTFAYYERSFYNIKSWPKPESAKTSEYNSKQQTTLTDWYMPIRVGVGECDHTDICPVLDMASSGNCQPENPRVSKKLKYYPTNEICCPVTHCFHSLRGVHETHYAKYSRWIPINDHQIQEEKGMTTDSDDFGACPRIQCANESISKDSSCKIVEPIEDLVIYRSISPFLECCPRIKCMKEDGSYSLEMKITGMSFSYYEKSFYNIPYFQLEESKMKKNKTTKASKNGTKSETGARDSDCKPTDICPQIEMGTSCHEIPPHMSGFYVPRKERCCDLMHCFDFDGSQTTHYVKYSGWIPTEAEQIQTEKGGPSKKSSCSNIKCGNVTALPRAESCKLVSAESIYKYIVPFQECCEMIECQRKDGAYSWELRMTSISFTYYEISFYNIHSWNDDGFGGEYGRTKTTKSGQTSYYSNSYSETSDTNWGHHPGSSGQQNPNEIQHPGWAHNAASPPSHHPGWNHHYGPGHDQYHYPQQHAWPPGWGQPQHPYYSHDPYQSQYQYPYYHNQDQGNWNGGEWNNQNENNGNFQSKKASKSKSPSASKSKTDANNGKSQDKSETQSSSSSESKSKTDGTKTQEKKRNKNESKDTPPPPASSQSETTSKKNDGKETKKSKSSSKTSQNDGDNQSSGNSAGDALSMTGNRNSGGSTLQNPNQSGFSAQSLDNTFPQMNQMFQQHQQWNHVPWSQQNSNSNPWPASMFGNSWNNQNNNMMGMDGMGLQPMGMGSLQSQSMTLNNGMQSITMNSMQNMGLGSSSGPTPSPKSNSNKKDKTQDEENASE